MSRYPTTAEIAAFLREAGEPAMAMEIEALRRNYDGLREVNEQNVAAYNALLAKQQPRQWRPPDHVARGRQSD